jgi:hypothetical protein
MYIPFCNRNERILQVQEEWHEYFQYKYGKGGSFDSRLEDLSFKIRSWMAWNM